MERLTPLQTLMKPVHPFLHFLFYAFMIYCYQIADRLKIYIAKKLKPTCSFSTEGKFVLYVSEKKTNYPRFMFERMNSAMTGFIKTNNKKANESKTVLSIASKVPEI